MNPPSVIHPSHLFTLLIFQTLKPNLFPSHPCNSRPSHIPFFFHHLCFFLYFFFLFFSFFSISFFFSPMVVSYHQQCHCQLTIPFSIDSCPPLATSFHSPSFSFFLSLYIPILFSHIFLFFFHSKARIHGCCHEHSSSFTSSYATHGHHTTTIIYFIISFLNNGFNDNEVYIVTILGLNSGLGLVSILFRFWIY